MDGLRICINPGDLENPDLDVRYSLPEYLENRYQGLLEDNGYDFEQPGPLLVLSMSVHSEVTGLQMENIVLGVTSYNEYGEKLEKAVSMELIKEGKNMSSTQKSKRVQKNNLTKNSTPTYYDFSRKTPASAVICSCVKR